MADFVFELPGPDGPARVTVVADGGGGIFAITTPGGSGWGFLPALIARRFVEVDQPGTPADYGHDTFRVTERGRAGVVAETAKPKKARRAAERGAR